MMTIEELTTFWAVYHTGHAPTAEQLALAKQRVSRRGLSFMPATQLEIETLQVMKESTRHTLNIYTGDDVETVEFVALPLNRAAVRKHIRDISEHVAELMQRRRDVAKLEREFGVKFRRDREHLADALADLKSEIRFQRRRLRNHRKQRNNNVETIK